MWKKEDVKPGTLVMINPIVKDGQKFKYGKGTSTLTLQASARFKGFKKIKSRYDDQLWDVVRIEGQGETYYQINMLIKVEDFVDVFQNETERGEIDAK